MPKLGDAAALPRSEVAEQLNDDGVINAGFPTGECRGRRLHEQTLGEVTAKAVLIPDWLGSLRSQRYTARGRTAGRAKHPRLSATLATAAAVPVGRTDSDRIDARVPSGQLHNRRRPRGRRLEQVAEQQFRGGPFRAEVD